MRKCHREFKRYLERHGFKVTAIERTRLRSHHYTVVFTRPDGTRGRHVTPGTPSDHKWMRAAITQMSQTV